MEKAPRHLEDVRFPLGIVGGEFHADSDGSGNPTFCHKGNGSVEEDTPGLLVDSVYQTGEHFGNTGTVLSQAGTTILQVPWFTHLVHTAAPEQRIWHAPILSH